MIICKFVSCTTDKSLLLMIIIMTPVSCYKYNGMYINSVLNIMELYRDISYEITLIVLTCTIDLLSS